MDFFKDCVKGFWSQFFFSCYHFYRQTLWHLRMTKIIYHASSLNANYSAQKGHTSKLLGHSESWKSLDEFEKKSTIFCWDLLKLWAYKVEVWLIARSFGANGLLKMQLKSIDFPSKLDSCEKSFLTFMKVWCKSICPWPFEVGLWSWNRLGCIFSENFGPPLWLSLAINLHFGRQACAASN